MSVVSGVCGFCQGLTASGMTFPMILPIPMLINALVATFVAMFFTVRFFMILVVTIA
ncbi:hypothetical protein D3C78_1989220 [compost metagenome]